jgi:MFS transporter, DHA2 family, methylenomycin A resistance protein
VFVLSLDFQELRGDSPAAAGLHLTAITVSFGATSVLAGRLAARFGTRGLIASGLGILVISAGWAVALPHAVPFPLIAPALVMMGVGAGLVAPSMNAAILASVPPSLSGIGAGVLNASRQIGTALAVAIFASMFHGEDKVAAVRLALAWAGLIYLAALALSLRSTTTSRYSLGATSVASPERLPRSISSSRSRSSSAARSGVA